MARVLLLVLLGLPLFLVSVHALLSPSCLCGKQQQRVAIVSRQAQVQEGDVDTQDDDGCTKLFHACRAGDVARVEELLRMRASPDLVNNRGSSPLYVACENGKEDVVKILLDVSNASANKRDRSGFTPLFAATNNGHANVLRVLLGMTSIGPLPPHLLLEQLDAVDDEGWSCLFYATYKRRHECMKLLLAAAAAGAGGGAREKSEEKEGSSVLAGVINKQTQTDKWTCAWYASMSGYDETLQILLETNEVDVMLADAKGRSCLQIAEEKGRERCVALLNEYIARAV